MAGFSINIHAGPDKKSSRVTVDGQVEHIITDEERDTFGLGRQNLLNAMERYNGSTPQDVYLHEPTPQQSYTKDPVTFSNGERLTPVKTILRASSTRIVSVTSEPMIVKRAEFNNSSSSDVTYTADLKNEEVETVGTSWQKGGTFSVDQKINYGISFLGSGVKGETGLSYSQSWGTDGSKSNQVTIGSSSGVSVTLQPNQSVAATLSASKGVMIVEIDFDAHLDGWVIAQYQGCNSLLRVDAVLAESGLSNSIRTTATIKLDYFVNSSINVEDQNSGGRLKNVYTGHDTGTVMKD